MLYGERVRLRDVEREDIPTFVRWFNDPEVLNYLLMDAPMSMAEEERWFEAFQGSDDFVYAVETCVEGAWLHIGNVGLHGVDWKNLMATLGIVLGEKTYWGLGLGTDATRTALRVAFHQLNLHRVELEVFDTNSRARRCYARVGFRLEGARRSAHFQDGRYHDLHPMGILRNEFTADPEGEAARDVQGVRWRNEAVES